MINQIHSFITQHQLLPDSGTVIVGLSGGPDSIFLLHVLTPLHREKKISLIAAHLDHEWRADSSHDVTFCQRVADELQIPFVHAKASELATTLKKNGSQEELGRKLRRTFLENVAHTHGAKAIALAHHLQDQEETFFIRLIRGTTLTGLIGMRPKHGLYVRPLLETNKVDILQYLHEHNIAYLTDPTNVSENYLRNRIRLKVLPALQESDARFNHNFLRTVHNLQAAEQVLDDLTRALFSEIATSTDGTHYLHLPKFFSHNDYLQKRILLYWLILEQVPFVPTESFFEEIVRFLKQPQEKDHTLHRKWSLIKEKNSVYLKKTF